MKICHHLDEATVLRYASGDLEEAFLVVVATHIAMCDVCREAVHVAEEIGGYFLDEMETTDLQAGAFESLMQRLGSDKEPLIETFPAVKKRFNDGDMSIPEPLRRYIGPSLENIAWRTVAPGVQKYDIQLESEFSSPLYMLKIAAGKAVPEHGHGGDEMTLILSGAYRDQLGRFGPGDIADLDEHLEHQPHVEPGAPCICLVATEAPTRFKGFFSRLFQPLVGI